MRRVALAADQGVVMATPVDTGRARSNWIVALGTPPSQVINAYSPGDGGSSASANTQAALDQGEAVIRDYSGEGAQEIHITNNLPYIQGLNDGNSAQAPANFVQKAVIEAIQVIQGGGILDKGK